MNRMHITVVTLGLLAAAGPGWGQECPANTVRVTSGTPATPNNGIGDLMSFVRGTTFCVARGAERWQEFHATSGELIDYKLGPGHPVDPTKTVGTWTVTGMQAVVPADVRAARARRVEGGVVTHTYGQTSYSFAVCVPSAEARRANPSFVLVSPTAGTFEKVRILTGQLPCP